MRANYWPCRSKNRNALRIYSRSEGVIVEASLRQDGAQKTEHRGSVWGATRYARPKWRIN